MVDVIIKENEENALNDLSSLINSTEDIPTLINGVARYNTALGEAKTKKEIEKNPKALEKVDPKALLSGIKRDMRGQGNER